MLCMSLLDNKIACDMAQASQLIESLRQEDGKLEANWSNLVRPQSKQKNNKGMGRELEGRAPLGSVTSLFFFFLKLFMEIEEVW